MKMNDIKLPGEAKLQADLIKKVGDGWSSIEQGWLLNPWKVGASCRVGTLHSRTYSEFDWWTTSVTKEIKEVVVTKEGTDIIFQTLNNIYMLRLRGDIRELFDEEIEGLKVEK